MRHNTHIDFNGECAAAFKVNEQGLGGATTFMLTYGASPAAASYPDLKDKIAHATLKVGGQTSTGGRDWRSL